MKNCCVDYYSHISYIDYSCKVHLAFIFKYVSPVLLDLKFSWVEINHLRS